MLKFALNVEEFDRELCCCSVHFLKDFFYIPKYLLACNIYVYHMMVGPCYLRVIFLIFSSVTDWDLTRESDISDTQ